MIKVTTFHHKGFQLKWSTETSRRQRNGAIFVRFLFCCGAWGHPGLISVVSIIAMFFFVISQYKSKTSCISSWLTFHSLFSELLPFDCKIWSPRIHWCVRGLAVLHRSSFCFSIRLWPIKSKSQSSEQITLTNSFNRRPQQVKPAFNDIWLLECNKKCIWFRDPIRTSCIEALCKLQGQN